MRHTQYGVDIEAESIAIGENVTFGKDVDIVVENEFEIGSFSHLGNNVHIRGNNVIIGEHLYHSFGLRIGGGGANNPTANLVIGDRCTIHNNQINIAMPVSIGDDVGLSEEVTLYTHGYWMSVLEGFPAKFEGINIGSGTIIGFRSIILPGVTIPRYSVVGAGSVVTGSLGPGERCVFAGNPAVFIRGIKELTYDEKNETLHKIVKQYRTTAKHHGVKIDVTIDYPIISCNKFVFNVETFKYYGTEDDNTDDFRDYMRKWGIRIYTRRPFVSKKRRHLF